MIIKLCGMRHPDNIRQIDQLGTVDWMGFIFYPPSSRHVSQVPDYLPQHCRRVGVFVNATHEEILQRQASFALDIIQLHGHESPDYCRELRHRLKAGTRLIKTVQIATQKDLEDTHRHEGLADYFLFETKSNSYGGSGQQFDWHILHRYQGQTPFLIAGGIGADDAARVKAFHHPRWVGIDLNSRFEIAPALKDPQRLQAFIRQLNN